MGVVSRPLHIGPPLANGGHSGPCTDEMRKSFSKLVAWDQSLESISPAIEPWQLRPLSPDLMASHLSTKSLPTKSGSEPEITSDQVDEYDEAGVCCDISTLKTRDGDPWTPEEDMLCIKLMTEICKAGQLTGEARFDETARRMRLMGFDRRWSGVKNAWNRRLRERSKLDERRKKGSILATSKQDKESKRVAREKRQELEWQNKHRRGTTMEKQHRRESSESSSKRERPSAVGKGHDDHEMEVMPAKRRRGSPYPGDYFHGLP